MMENSNANQHQNRLHLWLKFKGSLVQVIKKMMNIMDTILDSRNWVLLHFQTKWKHTFCSYKSEIQKSKILRLIRAYVPEGFLMHPLFLITPEFNFFSPFSSLFNSFSWKSRTTTSESNGTLFFSELFPWISICV